MKITTQYFVSATVKFTPYAGKNKGIEQTEDFNGIIPITRHTHKMSLSEYYGNLLDQASIQQNDVHGCVVIQKIKDHIGFIFSKTYFDEIHHLSSTVSIKSMSVLDRYSADDSQKLDSE
jgi:hypothetical protein